MGVNGIVSVPVNAIFARAALVGHQTATLLAGVLPGVLGVCIFSDARAAHPTAAFTLDVERRGFVPSREKPVAEQMSAWAETCSVVSGDPIYTLHCRPGPPERRAPPQDLPELIEASLVLFRDLDEVLYVAGCPVIEDVPESEPAVELESPRDGPGRRPRPRPKAVDERDVRDCASIEKGRTFTTLIEHDVMKIVIRGRQLPLTIFDVRPKQITSGSPYELTPARTRASPAPNPLPASSRTPEPGAEPEFRPPPLGQQSEGRPSRLNSNGAPPAKTSLRTGRLVIECESSRAAVYVDGAYYGSCPLQLPVIAGSHSITVRRPRREDWVHKVIVGAGKALKVRVH